MKEKVMNLNIADLRNLLLILTVSGHGFIRAYTWITSDVITLKDASDIYVKMEQIVDIKAVGWVLFVASIALFLTEFLKASYQKYTLVVSSFVSSMIHLAFGMIGVESANISTTYYTNLLMGMVLFLIFVTGVIDIWKMKTSQTID